MFYVLCSLPLLRFAADLLFSPCLHLLLSHLRHPRLAHCCHLITNSSAWHLISFLALAKSSAFLLLFSSPWSSLLLNNNSQMTALLFFFCHFHFPTCLARLSLIVQDDSSPASRSSSPVLSSLSPLSSVSF
jgi:hypothetical protein